MRRHAKAVSAGSNHCRVAGLGAVLGATLLLLLVAPGASAKSIDTYFPASAGDVAVNEATGDIYVAQDNERRVERFSADGTPELAWGKDVIEDGPGNVGYEVCQFGVDACKQGEGGAAKGEFVSSSPDGIAIDQVDGSVYVWDTRSGNSASDENLRIQKFDADGNFILMFGKEVNATTGGDVCTEASGDVCQAGVETSAPGGFGNPSINEPNVAISPIDRDVFVADPLNRRVQRFDPDGTFVGVIGSSANFGSQQPRQVAIDSQGILYASDGNSSAQIDRYDAYGAHGAPGFLASIAAPPLLTGGTSATVGLEIDLDSEGDGAAGLDTDRLYVLRDPSSGETVVQQLDSPGEVLAPAAVSATHGAGDGFASVDGLGLNSASGELYVATGGGLGKVWVLTDGGDGLPQIDASLGPVTNIGARQADLTAAIDPGEDEEATYRFEYAAGGSAFQPLPSGTVSGTGDQPVSETLTGLTPNAPYRVRLYAEKVSGPTSTESTLTGEGFFFTAALAPEVTTLAPHIYTDTSAWLAGEVNPNGSATTYRFEWGTSTAYNHQVPLPDASAGAAGTARGVIEPIEGLEPDTTYHYRLVAESPVGETVGADRTFTTRSAFEGFAGRAYEQVSPVFKNAGAINHDRTLAEGSAMASAGASGYSAAVAADGSAAVFASADAFADAEWGANTAASEVPLFYQARRNADGSGWTTRATVPRAPSLGAAGQNGISIAPTLYGGPADGKAAFDSTLSMTGPTPPNAGGGYVREWASGDLTTVFEGLSNTVFGSVVGASADFEHVLFETALVLSSEPGIPAGATKLYEWNEGEIGLVGLDELGAPFPTSVRLGRYSGAAQRTAVSDDGRHVFFSNAPGGGGVPAGVEIYRRSDGTTTRMVSPSKASAPDPLGPKGKVFSAATDDGDRVFFMSAEQLTDEANTGPAREGNDLYRYEISSDSLIDISAEANDAAGAQVRGVLGISDDGDTVYYVARGQVLAGEGTPGENNVYRWHDDGSATGETRFIATLAPGSSSNSVHPNDEANLGADSTVSSFDEESQTSRVSADGETLLFQSTVSLTGYRNQGFAQVYVYEADANGGEGQLSCASCPPNGATATAHSSIPYGGIASESGDAPARFLSADGSRVFFNSEADLIAADTNGVQDVYLWEQGRLALVSTGKSAAPSFLHGASRSGGDVFFLTVQQLVGQDNDGQMDVYDYRVGGGIAEQSPPPPGVPCRGSECKPPLSAPPPPPPVTTPAFVGQGNVKERARKRRCPKGKRRVRSKRGKTRCVRRHRAKRKAARAKRSNHTRKRGHK